MTEIRMQNKSDNNFSMIVDKGGRHLAMHHVANSWPNAVLLNIIIGIFAPNDNLVR